jgi:hypothetical protein
MRYQAKKISIILSILIILSGSLLGYLFIFIRQNILEASTYESTIEQQDLDETTIRSLRVLLSDLQPDIDRLKKRIVPAAGTIPVIEMIETLARTINLRVTVESVDVTPIDKNNAEYQNLVLRVATEGPWLQTRQFLSYLEVLPYKVSVTCPRSSMDRTADF